MAYVIVKSNGLMVARPGHRTSYTDKVELAAVFATREQAESHRCVENERVVESRPYYPSPNM